MLIRPVLACQESRPRGIARILGPFVALLAFLIPGPAAGATTWLPPLPVFRSLEADPLEPRMGVTFDDGGDRIDAALGQRIALVESDARGRRAGVVLEAGGYLTLGRDGSFFPLRTFDGVFGLSGEAAHGAWSARLRLLHRSAHKADGDTTVAYRDGTWSREFAWLDVSRTLGPARLYARIGAAWHAVPRDPGPRVAWGAEWHGGGHGPRPVAALHVESSRERDWRQTGTLFLGVAFGGGREAVFGARIHRGESFPGRYAGTTENLTGFELRIRPREGDAGARPNKASN